MKEPKKGDSAGVRIESILNQSIELFKKHHKETEIGQIQKLLKKASAENVSVLVCGEFKRGKSSFINAFLNENICPTDAGIATSVVSVIQYGDHKKVTRIFGEPSNLETQEIRFDEIEKYAKGSQMEIDNTIMLSIEIPSEKLKNGLILMDSPGVGGLDPRHLFVTSYVMPKADVTFFVVDAGEPLSTTELDFYKDKILAYSKKSVIILNKSDLKSKDEIHELIEDTKRKISDHCKIKKEEIEIIPVSSAHWAVYNRTQSEKMRTSSNCDNVLISLESVIPLFRRSILEEAKTSLLQLLKSVKILEQYQLTQISNPDENAQSEFKKQLQKLKNLKNNISNPSSQLRKNINHILKNSQTKVINELSRQSILFSTDVLNQLLSRPEAKSEKGWKWVLAQVNTGIQTLSAEIDMRIEAGFNDVKTELGEDIQVSEGGFHERIDIDLTPQQKTIAQQTFGVTRSALPSVGVFALTYTLVGFLMPVVAPIASVFAAGAFFTQNHINTNSAERLAELKQRLSPQISVAMNDLKAYVQRRFDEFGEALVNKIETMVAEVVADMQEIIAAIQKIEDDKNKIKAQKEKIRNTINSLDNSIKQAELILTNPFAKKQ